MRLVLLVVMALVLTPVSLEVAAPTASACTGDPSVCGVKRSADCTTRDGAATQSDLERCWAWV